MNLENLFFLQVDLLLDSTWKTCTNNKKNIAPRDLTSEETSLRRRWCQSPRPPRPTHSSSLWFQNVQRLGGSLTPGATLDPLHEFTGAKKLFVESNLGGTALKKFGFVFAQEVVSTTRHCHLERETGAHLQPPVVPPTEQRSVPPSDACVGTREIISLEGRGISFSESWDGMPR